MNYLCHARDCLDRPYELLGTILPDWLRILDRRARVRPWMLNGLASSAGDSSALALRGLRRHFKDDAWFHATPAFSEVTGEIARMIRAVHPDRPERRMRASFYAHLLLEMLLDAWLMEERPSASRDFAAAIGMLDPAAVAEITASISPCRVEGIEKMVAHFTDPRVIEGYLHDGEVVRRLDRMGHHVNQPDLPLGLVEQIGPARALVRRHGSELLTEP
jgi:hypothetical protein